MVTRENIFAFISSTNVTYKEKDKIIAKKEKLLKEAIKIQDSTELVEYLFNAKIPKNAKKIISSELDKRNYTLEEEEEIKNIFQNHQGYKENDLFKNYYPQILKKYIVNTIFKENILNILVFSKKTYELKREIIKNAVDKKELSILLSELRDKKLINFILDTKFYDVQNIIYTLYNEKVNEEIKLIIIKRFINKNNILNILSQPIRESLKDTIIKEKNDILEERINILTTNEIYDLITNENYPKSVYDMLLTKQLKNIKKLFNTMSFNKFRKALCKVKDSKIASIMINDHPLKTKFALLYSKEISILSWLYNDFLPLEIKAFILKNRQKDLEIAIKSRKIGNLKLCYLRETQNIPVEVQELIINLKKEEFINDLKNKPKSIIISEIIFGGYCEAYKEFIIKNILDEEDLKYLITKKNEELISLIFKLHDKTLENIIWKMPISELMLLSYFDNEFSKELAINKYSGLITRRINSLKKSEIYTYLASYNTNFSMKKLILKSLGIKEENIDNAIELIKYNDIEVAITNFEKIKEIITKSDINFDAFIQYGCGTENYKNWFDRILEIIENNHEEKFYNAVKYLMNELYLDDQNKENLVYTIKNFLEIIDVFSSCYELIMNLTNESVLLDKESRNNLSQLFKSNYKNKNEIKTLDDLKEMRKKILSQNSDTINNTKSLEELKNVFESIVLKNSSNLLEHIGGIKTLIYLRKSNEENKQMTAFIDNIIMYAKVIEAVKRCENIESLRKILKYFVIENPDKLVTIEASFGKFSKDIQKLFELDAKLNLSNLLEAEKLGLIDEELSKEYGGKVYDLSKVNYCLYAHVLSRFEKVEMLVNGESDSGKNFMSVSPISYLGQRYYCLNRRPIFAIDKIPSGSFICSSLSNMGSNCKITRNSTEVREIKHAERSILETSAVTETNSEVLLYREKVKVSGIILPNGRKPTPEELEYHQKFNLPFIITQDIACAVPNVRKVFSLNSIDFSLNDIPCELEEILNILTKCIFVNKQNKIYTGREIALITDAHSLYEPTLRVLEDIRQNNITEIYSLGDNIGVGPNPHEIMELFEKYNVISIAGNSEYYSKLGIDSFTYFDKEKRENQEWTFDKLSTSDLNTLKLYKPSIDIKIGDKKIGLCHFANDVRWDYLGNNSTWAYVQNFKKGITSKQFLYTNSDAAKAKIQKIVDSHNPSDKKVAGLIDALKNPLLNGKKVTDYDAIIQGHVHFHLDDYLNSTKIHTLRAIGMGYSKEDFGNACYYVIKEKNDGTFDIEKRLVEFNRNLLQANIVSSDIPHKEKVLKFTRI